MGAPLRSHWYERLADGLHVPALTARVLPYVAVPVMAGVGAVVKAVPGIAVGADVLVTTAKPGLCEVMDAVNWWPASARVRRYRLVVAPGISTPSRNHR